MDTKSDTIDVVLSERDALIAKAARELAEVFNVGLWSLPASTQKMVDQALKNGTARAAMSVVLTPWPTFHGILLTEPGHEPIELFRVQPAQGSLPLAQKEQTH